MKIKEETDSFQKISLLDKKTPCSVPLITGGIIALLQLLTFMPFLPFILIPLAFSVFPLAAFWNRAQNRQTIPSPSKNFIRFLKTIGWIPFFEVIPLCCIMMVIARDSIGSSEAGPSNFTILGVIGLILITILHWILFLVSVFYYSFSQKKYFVISNFLVILWYMIISILYVIFVTMIA